MEITPKTKEAPVDLGQQDALFYFSSYREYEPENDLAYSDLEPSSTKGPVFVLPGYLSGSDYSGGSVTVSNHRLFIEEFGELDGVHNVYGGYGSYGVAIRLDLWRKSLDGDCTWLGTDPETAACDPEDGPCPHHMREPAMILLLSASPKTALITCPPTLVRDWAAPPS